MQLDKRVITAHALALAFALMPLSALAQEEAPDPGVNTDAKSQTTLVDKLKDKSRQPYKVEPDKNKSSVISIHDMLFERQVEHEKNLIHKFLLGVSILFSIIAMLLFVSLPPQDNDKLKAESN